MLYRVKKSTVKAPEDAINFTVPKTGDIVRWEETQDFYALVNIHTDKIIFASDEKKLFYKHASAKQELELEELDNVYTIKTEANC